MTTKDVVSDEQLGLFAVRQNELFQRVRKGSVPFHQTYSSLQQLIEGVGLGANSRRDTYTVPIDYTRTLEEMIAAGRYDWKHDDITSRNFQVKGEGQITVDITLVHYGRVMNKKTVLKDLDEQGFCPATIGELLALGATQPELQRQFPIIAPGSVWRHSGGQRYCPGLDRDGSERLLRLHWIDGDFDEFCRFVAVRKTSTTS